VARRKVSAITPKKLSKGSVRRKGVTKQIKEYYFLHPKASTKKCCSDLDLFYEKYKRMIWKIKSETKGLLEGKVQVRVHKPLSHRVEWKTEKLPREIVETIRYEALKRQPRKDQPKPMGEWYVVPNRNRLMIYRSAELTVKVYPKSGTVRVLPAKPIEWGEIKICLEEALFKAGLDLRVCEGVSEGLEPASGRHRIFYIGPITPFKEDFYKKSHGLTLLADGSHPEHLEAIENCPVWVKPLVHIVSKGQEHLESVVDRFEKSMDKHLELIDVFRKESEERTRAFKRTKRKPKPKRLSRWQMFKKAFSA